MQPLEELLGQLGMLNPDHDPKITASYDQEAAQLRDLLATQGLDLMNAGDAEVILRILAALRELAHSTLDRGETQNLIKVGAMSLHLFPKEFASIIAWGASSAVALEACRRTLCEEGQ